MRNWKAPHSSSLMKSVGPAKHAGGSRKVTSSLTGSPLKAAAGEVAGRMGAQHWHSSHPQAGRQVQGLPLRSVVFSQVLAVTEKQLQAPSAGAQL